MRYEDWNELLTNHFFSSEKAGQRVYLYVTDALLERLSPEGSAGFIKAIKQQHRWAVRSASIYQGAADCLRVWERERNNLIGFDQNCPPYIGYLCFFALAAAKDDPEWSARGYYRVLNPLMGRAPDAGTPPHFAEVDTVWHDLARWANVERDGEFGLFHAERANHNAHVGYPLAQALLTDKERGRLPRLFGKAGLLPSTFPADEELSALVLRYDQSDLKPRTRRLLADPAADSSARRVLLGVLADALASWDSRVPDDENVRTPSRTVENGALWLTLREDGGFGRYRSGLIAQAHAAFPEDELTLVAPGGEHWSCAERGGGWSWPLKDEADAPVAATALAWGDDVALKTASAGRGAWTFRMGGSPVRLFVSGQPQGLPGYVETRPLRRGVPFRVAVAPDEQALVEAWGAADCTGFRSLPVQTGLPDGWALYAAEAAVDDAAVPDRLPRLAFATTLSLRWEGGVRVASRGDEFFAFAPPLVVMDGDVEGDVVTANGRPLVPVGGGRYELPEAVRAEARIVVEVRRGTDIPLRRVLTLRTSVVWNRVGSGTAFGRFGQPLAAEHEEPVSLSGAVVHGELTVQDRLRTFLPRHAERRVYLVGQAPGQIARWPQEDLPTWEPVWEVPMERQGRALFVGTSLDALPLSETTGARKQRKQWADLFRHARRITPPRSTGAARLWHRYVKAAR